MSTPHGRPTLSCSRLGGRRSTIRPRRPCRAAGLVCIPTVRSAVCISTASPAIAASASRSVLFESSLPLPGPLLRPTAGDRRRRSACRRRRLLNVSARDTFSLGVRRNSDEDHCRFGSRLLRVGVDGVVRRRPTPGGGAGDRRAPGRPVWLGRGLRDGIGCAARRAAGVRRGLFRGADVRALRGLCRGPGRRQHGGGLGRVVRLGVRGASGGAVGMQRPRRRFRLCRSGVGLQRSGCRGRSGSGPRRASSDSVGPAVCRLRPPWSGRLVRSSDACGDPGLAVVARRACDGVSGRPGGGGVADGGRVCAGGCGSGGAGPRPGSAGADGGTGDGVLAVDRQQHEPCRVRGVPVAVPERGVQRAGACASGGASVAGRHAGRGRPYARRRHASGDLRRSGLRRIRAGPSAQRRPRMRGGAPGRCSGTAPSARRWWCWRAAAWRWAATR